MCVLVLENAQVLEERIALALKAKRIGRPNGWSMPELAAELANLNVLGLNQKSQWLNKLKNSLSRTPESRVSIPDEAFPAIEEILGLQTGWIKSDVKEPLFRGDRSLRAETGEFVISRPAFTNLGKEIPVGRAGVKIVPVYGSVPAGIPGQTFSDAIDFIEMTEWGGDFDRWGRVIEGDSMEPEFCDGDIVIFENRQALHNRAVHALREGQDAFKILVETEPGLGEFWPTNEKYKPFSADGWTVLGPAIQRIRTTVEGADIYVDTRKYPNGYRWKKP